MKLQADEPDAFAYWDKNSNPDYESEPSRMHILRPDRGKTICARTPPARALLADSAPLYRVCHNCLRALMKPYL